MVQYNIDKIEIIRSKLKTTQDKQKSYVDLKTRDTKYSVGGKVFLRISPWKWIV